MKKIFLKLIILALLVTSLQGCYGKFALTRKVYAVNGEISDKFLRSGLTWVFLFFPVYGIAGLADFLLFNTIEFWSGKNPVVEGEKDFRYVDGTDRFEIHAHRSGDVVAYEIAHYKFDTYVDTLKVDWNINQDVVRSRYNYGGSFSENGVAGESNRVQLQLRQFQSLPQTIALFGK